MSAARASPPAQPARAARTTQARGRTAHTVRSACPADAAEIARLAGELGYPSQAATMRTRLLQLAEDSRHWVAVAVPEGIAAAAGTAAAGAIAAIDSQRLGGWVHVARCATLEGGEYAEILGLVVDSQARRAGVGRLLARAAERWGAEQGLLRLTVRSNAARVQAHEFYPALSFTRVKTQHVYVKTLGEPTSSPGDPAGDPGGAV